MAARKKPAAFAAPVEEVEESVDENTVDDQTVVVDEPVVVLTKNSDLISARVKGTWKMFWGRDSYSFVDGKRYQLPRDLFNYLKKSGNIYDTL